MKKFLLLALFAIASTLMSMAQDVIITKDGQEIKAKVSEVLTTQIKYKKYESPDGPLYTVNKADLLLIRYENGSIEVMNPEENNTQQSTPATQNTPIQNAQTENVGSSNVPNYDEPATRFSLYAGTLIPTGSFADGVLWGLSLGFQIDARLANHLYLFGSWDIMYNSIDEVELQDELWKANISLEDAPSFFNFPCLLGLNYTIPVDAQASLYAEGGLGLNICYVSPYEVSYASTSYSRHYETITFDPSISFAWTIGVGGIAFKHLNVGVRYVNMGSNSWSLSDGTTMEICPSAVQLKVGVTF